MWRSSCHLLKQGLTSAVRGRTTSPLQGIRACLEANEYSYGCLCGARSLALLSTATGSCDGGGGDGLNGGGANGESITFAEAKRLMRLVNVESLKMKLGMEDKEVIGYSELLEACENLGVAKSVDEQGRSQNFCLFRAKLRIHTTNKILKCGKGSFLFGSISRILCCQGKGGKGSCLIRMFVVSA